jgi:hypothetical protein
MIFSLWRQAAMLDLVQEQSPSSRAVPPPSEGYVVKVPQVTASIPSLEWTGKRGVERRETRSRKGRNKEKRRGKGGKRGN